MVACIDKLDAGHLPGWVAVATFTTQHGSAPGSFDDIAGLSGIAYSLMLALTAGLGIRAACSHSTCVEHSEPQFFARPPLQLIAVGEAKRLSLAKKFDMPHGAYGDVNAGQVKV